MAASTPTRPKSGAVRVRRPTGPLVAAVVLAVAGLLAPWTVASASAAPAPPSPATITAVSGSGQTAEAHQQFPEALVARVTDADGNPVGGVPVTFTLPRHDEPTDNVIYDDGSLTRTVTTGPDGTATNPPLYADRPIGGTTASATFDGGASPATWALTVIKPANAKADLSPFIGGLGKKAKKNHALEVSVSVYDDGPDVADYVTMRLTLPHGWRVLDPLRGTQVSKRTVDFSVSTIDPGAESALSMIAKTSRHRGHYTITAHVFSGTSDPIKSNDTVKKKIRLT